MMKRFLLSILLCGIFLSSFAQPGIIYAQGDKMPSNALWFNADFQVSFDACRDKVVVLAVWSPETYNAIETVVALEERLERIPQVQLISIMYLDSMHHWSRNEVNCFVQMNKLSHPIGITNNVSELKNLNFRQFPHLALYKKSNIPSAQTLNGSDKEFYTELDKVLNDAELLKGIAAWTIKDSIELGSWADPLPEEVARITCSSDHLYLSENAHRRVLVLNGDGSAHNTIGSGLFGYVDGQFYAARFKNIVDVEYDSQTNQLFIADMNNHRLRVADPNSDLVYTLVGNGLLPRESNDSIHGLNSAIGYPSAIASNEGMIYVASALTNEVFEINPKNGEGKKVFTLPNMTLQSYSKVYISSMSSGKNGVYCVLSNGKVGQIQQGKWVWIFEPKQSNEGIAEVLEKGKKLFATMSDRNQLVTLVQGKYKVLTGQSNMGFSNGTNKTALFSHPIGMCFFQSRIMVADWSNHLVRSVVPKKGTVRTLTIAPDERLQQTGDALNAGEIVYFESLICGKGQNTITVKFDLSDYTLLPGAKNEVYVDESSSTRLESNTISNDSFIAKFRVKEEEPYIQFELYLTLRNDAFPERTIFKRSMINIPIETIEGEPNTHELTYKPHLLPY